MKVDTRIQAGCVVRGIGQLTGQSYGYFLVGEHRGKTVLVRLTTGAVQSSTYLGCYLGDNIQDQERPVIKYEYVAHSLEEFYKQQ